MAGLTKRNSRTSRARAHRAFTASHRSETVTRNPPPEGFDPSLAWYLVFTSPRGEARAADGLQQAGCSVFWPSEHKIKVTSRRRMEYDTATFPRYVFAAGLPHLEQRLTVVGPDGRSGVAVNGEPITDIRQIDGVCDVIRSGDGRWARVPVAVMAAIADHQNSSPPPPAAPAYRPGQQIRIIDGPFMSFLATVMDVLGRQEAHVLVEIFGRQTPLRTELANIEPA